MKSSRKKIARTLLSLVALGGIAMMVLPAAQGAYGVWTQRQLLAQWENSASPEPVLSSPAFAEPSARQIETSLEIISPDGTGEREDIDPIPARIAERPAPATSAIPSAEATPVGGDDGIKSRVEAPATVPNAVWRPTRIVVPRIGLDAVVVRGVDERALRRGPGHDPLSELPGQPGNCVIAAHRNMYGFWFYRLDRLGPGHTIELRTPEATYTYKIAFTRSVPESDTSFLAPPAASDAAPRLTLYTCTLPKTSNRLVVVANLVR